MKAIITKYWMTSGPRLLVGNEVIMRNARRRAFKSDKQFSYPEWYWGRDWHTTKASAIDDVHKRVEKKRQSLLRLIVKLDRKRDEAVAAIQEMEL